MIRIRHAVLAVPSHPVARDVRPTSSEVCAYDLAREIVAQLEEGASLALVVEVEDDDGEPAVSGAEFSNDGIAIIERAVQAALRNGGIRP